MKGNQEPGAAGEGFHHPSTSLPRCWKCSSRLCRETGRDICRGERGAQIEGQNGERDFLTFITLERIQEGEVIIFYLVRRKKGGKLFLALTPQGFT